MVTLKTIVDKLREHGEFELAEEIRAGNFYIPFIDTTDGSVIDWPVLDIVESGTPVNEDSGEDCELAFPIV